MKSKKFICLLMAVCLIMCMMPMVALGADLGVCNDSTPGHTHLVKLYYDGGYIGSTHVGCGAELSAALPSFEAERMLPLGISYYFTMNNDQSQIPYLYDRVYEDIELSLNIVEYENGSSNVPFYKRTSCNQGSNSSHSHTLTVRGLTDEPIVMDGVQCGDPAHRDNTVFTNIYSDSRIPSDRQGQTIGYQFSVTTLDGIKTIDIDFDTAIITGDIELRGVWSGDSTNNSGGNNNNNNGNNNDDSLPENVPSAIENGMGIAGPYIYDEDLDIMMTPGEAGHVHEYGDYAYYLIIDEASMNEDGSLVGPMSDKDYAEKLKVKANGWTNGGDIVEGVDVIKCKVNVDALLEQENASPKRYECASIIADDYGYESGYYYFLEIDLGEKNSTAETDVIGVVEFNRKADNKKGIGKIDESSHDIDFSVFYEYSWLTKWPTISSDRVNFEWDTTYALKFDYDEEVELSFGTPNGGNNEGTFEVDISGQGKVLLRYSTDPVEAISAANEGADIDYLLFNNVKFNRTGTFTYEMENGAHAYRIVDGKLVEMGNCYDESEEAFVFNTNRLEAYVFADRALENPA